MEREAVIHTYGDVESGFSYCGQCNEYVRGPYYTMLNKSCQMCGSRFIGIELH